jgi:D-lactate dehydrogenase (cytochrome)/glycolate oxidase
MALPALEKLGTTLLDDVAVPKPALPWMISRIEAIAAKHALTIGTFGHAGDGNLHPTIVFKGGDAQAEARARAAFEEILHAALEMGGTLSGEHGIGSLKQRFLKDMIGPAELALMQRVKHAFDPNGILNPGRAL